MGFNTLEDKSHKVIGGCFTLVFIILIVLPTLLINLQSWYFDKNPYISSIVFPHSVKGEYERESKVTLDEVNTMFFMLRNYKYEAFGLRESERYIKYELKNYHYSFDENGERVEVSETYDDIHDCTQHDFHAIE